MGILILSKLYFLKLQFVEAIAFFKNWMSS